MWNSQHSFNNEICICWFWLILKFWSLFWTFSCIFLPSKIKIQLWRNKIKGCLNRIQFLQCLHQVSKCIVLVSGEQLQILSQHHVWILPWNLWWRKTQAIQVHRDSETQIWTEVQGSCWGQTSSWNAASIQNKWWETAEIQLEKTWRTDLSPLQSW